MYLNFTIKIVLYYDNIKKEKRDKSFLKNLYFNFKSTGENDDFLLVNTRQNLDMSIFLFEEEKQTSITIYDNIP